MLSKDVELDLLGHVVLAVILIGVCQRATPTQLNALC